jgi:hypothetical protein
MQLTICTNNISLIYTNTHRLIVWMFVSHFHFHSHVVFHETLVLAAQSLNTYMLLYTISIHVRVCVCVSSSGFSHDRFVRLVLVQFSILVFFWLLLNIFFNVYIR